MFPNTDRDSCVYSQYQLRTDQKCDPSTTQKLQHVGLGVFKFALFAQLQSQKQKVAGELA
jgi:hypothetical protein